MDSWIGDAFGTGSVVKSTRERRALTGRDGLVGLNEIILKKKREEEGVCCEKGRRSGNEGVCGGTTSFLCVLLTVGDISCPPSPPDTGTCTAGLT